MQDGRKVVAVHALRLGFRHGRRRYGDRPRLRRLPHRHLRLSLRGRCRPAEIAQAPFEFFDTLAERPLESLGVGHARLKAHAPIVCLAQKSLELCHMTAEPFDDCVGRLLEFLFQLLNRGGEILLILLAALAAMNDETDDKEEDGAENDERTENFSDGNNNQTPPLSASFRN